MKTALFLLIAAVPAALPISAQVKITPGAEKIPVEINGKPFTVFYAAGPEVSKPYLFPVNAASGTYVTRMWPMEKAAEEEKTRKDHPHQRGVWIAHAKVNDLDFWNIAPLNQSPYNRADRGKIVLSKMGEVKSGKDRGSIAAIFDWNDHEGRKVLSESRLMTFYADPALRIVDFDVTLTAAQKVVFGDEKDGFFGIRLRPVLQEEGGTGHITNADGLVGEKQLWGKPSNWCDYSGEIQGEKVGITIMDHPGNPRHPERWHARGYGLFAVNPFGLASFTNDKSQNGAMTLEPGQSLRFRYRMIVHPGDAQSANVAALWTKYAGGK
jgi:hypothetical protein